MADRKPRFYRLLAVVSCAALLAVLQGCSAPGFVSRPLDNFRAYYNTFYNARKAYERGVEAQTATGSGTERKVDRLEYVDIFGGQGDGRPSPDLESAIRKSADVLRDHPDSKWVDDALLLIGKSYFQQRNLVGAEQKFGEVIDLGTDLEDEARFWLARTLIAAGRLAEAEASIDESLAREQIEDRWEAMLRLARGELRVEEQSWEDAADQLTFGLRDVPEDDIGARGQFLLGQVLETLGRYEEAVQAYRDVQRFRPTYEWSYAAKFSAIRVQGLHVDSDRALSEVRRMERDDKHFAYRAELALLRGRIGMAVGRADDAWRVFDELLYDEAYAGLVGELRGRIHYALGELYRDLDRDFVLAAAHFDTAAAQLRAQINRTAGRSGSSQGTVVREPAWAPEAILDAEDLKTAFGDFARVHADVALMDSLLEIGGLDDEAFEQRILEIRQQRAREMEEERRRQEALAVEQAFARGASGSGSTSQNRSNRQNSRSDPNAAAGYLFHRDAVQAQEGRLSFEQEWGDRPLVRNWRRIDAVSRMPDEDLADEFADGPREEEGEDAEDALPDIDVSAIPRDSLARAAMTRELAAARYELANTLFLKIGRPDSAAAWYRLVLDESADEALGRRARFALAEVHQALGDTASAHGIYRQMVQDFPDTEFAVRGRARLGLPAVEIVVLDSAAVAESDYATQYEAWQRREYRWALDGMIRVASRHAWDPVRPRALLAAGLVWLEWAKADSLDPWEPLPVSEPDSVLIEMGLIVEPDLPDSTVVPDSVAAAGMAPGDSLSVPSESLESEMDSLATGPGIPSDSLAAVEGRQDLDPGVQPDSLSVPRDSLALVPDSLSVPRDSLALVPDSLAVPPDVLDRAEPEPPVDPDAWRRVTIERLLGHIRDTYGGSAFANRATDVLTALEARRQALAALADSLAAAALDSVAVAGTDSLIVPDSSLAVPAIQDSLAAPDSAELVVRIDTTQFSDPAAWREITSFEVRPLDDASGEVDAWFIVMQAVARLGDGPAVSDRYRERLVDLGEVELAAGRLDGEEAVLVVLGRFDSRQAAVELARSALYRLPPESWLLHVIPLEE